MKLQFIIILLATMALILLGVQNPNPIQLQFLSWQTGQVSQSKIIIISVITGIIISTFFSISEHLKLKSEIQRLEKKLNKLKQMSLKIRDDEDDE